MQTQGKAVGSLAIREPVASIVTGDSRLMPAWMLRSGIDRVRVPDLASPDLPGRNNSLNLEFGLTANLTEVLLAQLQQAVAFTSS